MIIQKNRRVQTSSQNLIHFVIGCHQEQNIWVIQLNIADTKKKIDPYNIVMICVETTTRMFCVGADVINYNVCYWFMIAICHTSMHI